MKNASRMIIQIVLAFPILSWGMFAALFVVVPFVPDFWTASRREMQAGAFLAAGGYGILGLLFSIFIPAGYVRKKKWLLCLLGTCLIAGSYMAVFLFTERLLASFDARTFLELLWVFGGPLAVAAWNTVRFICYKPNSS